MASQPTGLAKVTRLGVRALGVHHVLLESVNSIMSGETQLHHKFRRLQDRLNTRYPDIARRPRCPSRKAVS
jgi:hypothetical protein